MLAQADIEDLGPRAARGAPARTCIVTRAVKPVDELIRFVVAPDGAVVADLKRRLPGRGVWVTATRAAVDEAVKRKAFSRAFKREVRAAADLGAAVERQLERAALDALGIAHKAGRLAIGFARTEGALASEPVVAVLQAADGAADGARKIAAAVARRHDADGSAQIRTIAAFTTAQLDLALGRSNVVHAALLAGPASNGFLARCQSLERYRTVDPGGRGRVQRGPAGA
ncbi:MAG TPA: RNA-binding protein [Xanthobacteraceae bacterium]|nr:RNA-binding protein [Xanthobacteraceae bacterium]